MVAVDLDYSSYQDIREESGHQNLMKLEIPSGLVDGINTIFTVGRTYIVDRNYNDLIDVGAVDGDVIVYDDSVAVEVFSVDSTTGVIALSVAPAAASKILVSYAHSVLSDLKIDKYRAEAIDFVHRRINGIINFGAWEGADVPPIVQTVVRIYAAGLILIRDHGLNTDTENSSKDGYKRLSQAKSILGDYIDEAGDSSGATTRVSISAHSDGNIFARNTDLATWSDTVDSHECFMRNDC